jgi:predicted phage tail protein
MTMRNVFLHGGARKQFGGPFRFDVATPAQAARALFHLPSFESFLRRGYWKVIRCRGPLHVAIGEEELCLQCGGAEDLHLVPVAAGRASKGKGTGKVIIGVVIAVAAVVVAVWTGGTSLAALGATGLLGSVSFASIAMVGVGIALAGVSMLMAKTPQVKSYSNRENAGLEHPSFLFNGPVNTVAQGASIPVICGRKVRVGSFVISAGIFTERFVPAST